MIFGQHPTNKPVNQTIIWLTIIKDNTNILMRNTGYGWTTPFTNLTYRQTICMALNDMVTPYEIEVSKPRLAGLFTYRYKFKPTIDIQQHYMAYYKSGELKTSDKKGNITWMNRKKVIHKLGITIPSLSLQIRQILRYPRALWGGSFMIDRINDKFYSEMEEPFHLLN